ncbi:restriction endonuclease [Methylocystis sp. JAN1]|uniref:restriction endonuclease n=1 Tax=Methylocystis sp. JAN1 TaxID=3397211 RepID=UPI003FA27533
MTHWSSRGVAGWVVAIFVFTALAGFFWPHMAGIVFMGLAYFGVLHLAVLVYEQIAEPQFRADMSPEEFEHYCAALLRQAKWRADVTPASGDQGVDIVAAKRGRRIVVQCKMYAKPVRNRAVQEIVAGVAHVEAQRGVVVTTVGYTPAAEALAASNNVLLLHHSQLRRIDRLL